ncbi:hypothetical protein KC333_g8669 [Hortaea werneckii]|nr:hypothetical protein KC333_g8669 [Hortaea werneckii]KAI7303285.1 hypothetical protein KC326_g8708 [Hortaea werneckii]
MARRSSARLAGRASTPKRVSLSHDQPQANTTRTPRTVPAKLSSLDENDEMPGAFPQSPDSAPLAKRQRSTAPTDAHTPTENRSIQPSDQEMHPQKLHQTTAKPLDEARHLGFTQMPQTEPAGKKSRISTAQATPSRTTLPGKAPPNPAEDAKSPTYQFTFRREHSLELSPDAKRLMLEKREEAQRIREQMVRSGEGSDPNAVNADEMVAGRKLAKPKGRFSEVHGKAFDKMASIAGHKSAFRSKGSDNDSGMKTPQQNKEKTGVSVVEAAQKSLKRSPSKAQLDEPAEKKSLTTSPSKSNMTTGLPRAKQTHTLPAAPEAGPASPSPVKRQRRAEDDNVSSARPSSRDTPSTPQQQSVKKSVPSAISYPNLSALTTPTQSSLARAASTKKTETKIPGPQLARSPSKPNLTGKSADVQPQHHTANHQEEAGPSTPPLLQRSPSKSAHLFAGHTPAHFGQSQSRQPNEVQTGKGDSPLLSRTPRHGSPGKKLVENADAGQQAEGQATPQPAWLARSPHKMSVSRKQPADDPTKAAEQQQEKITSTGSGTGSHIPFLSRSPTKLPTHPHHLTAEDPTHAPSTPGKGNPGQEGGAGKGGLLSRFSLLRKPHSPMKSILRRSPQRKYSDDPAKIAAGTHLASPPSVTGANRPSSSSSRGLGDGGLRDARGEGVDGDGGLAGRGGGGGGAQQGGRKEDRKRVDFTASTKARYEEGRVGGGDGKGYGSFAGQEAEGDELEGLAREVDEEDAEVGAMDLDTDPQPPFLTSASEAEAEDEDEVDLEADATTEANRPTYPSLNLPAPSSPVTVPHAKAMPPSPSPQKRRQTFAPQDFTFRAGSQEIVFGNPTQLSSPGKTGAGSGGGRRRTTAAPTAAAPSSLSSETGMGGNKRRATIRAVSAEEPVGQGIAPATDSRSLAHNATGGRGESEAGQQGKVIPGSRKRKFDFENAHPDPAPVHEVLPLGGKGEDEEDGGSGSGSGKENRSLPFSSRAPGVKAEGKGKGKKEGVVAVNGGDDGEEEEMQDARPAKRTKTSSSTTSSLNPSTSSGVNGVQPSKTMQSAGSGTGSGTNKRRTTLGVKPRGEKKSAALALAGRRGGPGAGAGGVRRGPAGAGGAAGGAAGAAGAGSGGGAAGGAGTAGGVAGNGGNASGKSTISRERLNALAAPKRRG